VSVQEYARGGAHRDVLLRYGGLKHERSSAGRSFVTLSFTLLRSPRFSWEQCREIHPSNRPFNRSPGHYPGIRRANLRVTHLPAARRGLLAREGGGFNHGHWAEILFACAGRGAGPAPDSGQGDRRLMAGYIEPVVLNFILDRYGYISIMRIKARYKLQETWKRCNLCKLHRITGNFR
jgi:hypothetical protein